MDFEIPADITALLGRIDDFIEREIKPLERQDDNIRFFDHRREFARTDIDNGGVPRKEWYELLREMQRRADAAGLLRWALPKELGGSDGSNLGMAIVREHLAAKGLGLHNDLQNESSIVGNFPSVLMVKNAGTPEQQTWCEKMLKGEMRIAFGLTEPDHGSDATWLETTGVRDGDEWVINGAKIWNSGAQRCTHEWLCVRTDPDTPRHRGISVIMVPIDRPGIEIRPLYAWSGYRTNETFFRDVRVPVGNLIGEVNKGWTYITGALDLERGALTNAGDLRRALDDLVMLAGRPRRDGSVPANDPVFRRRLVQAEADVEVAKLMGYEAASFLDSGRIPSVEVSVEKIFTSELRQRISDLAIDLLGPDGLLAHRSAGAPLGGFFERLYRVSPLMRFGGGTNEVLRDVIAQRGHGMPSYGR
jgi:3-oxocholest-4-en-26-oyl-CoA dehydrogenase alpha subunit